jgi:hypothetical protein
MATGGEVLRMLCPSGGWVVYGDDFDSIIWDDDQPKCTKAQFTAGFTKYDAWKAEQETKAQADKTALLNKLGITANEAKLLLS